MTDYPLLNGFVQKRVIILGKELFRGMNMVLESSPLSEPLMAAGNFTQVINDMNFSGNHKAQFPLDVKIHQNPLAKGSVKSEGNGLLKGWIRWHSIN